MVEIIVTGHRDQYNAWLKNNPTMQGFGRTKKEAIGDLVCKEALSPKSPLVVTDWCFTPRYFCSPESKESSKVLE